MSVALTGAAGMLGSDIAQVLRSSAVSLFSFSSKTLDIQDTTQITQQLDAIPNLKYLINCAAYTQVDNCETNIEQAFSVNGAGVENLANYCKARGVILIHFSTDYVFDGTKSEPYIETDSPNPVNAYGRSKLAGEIAIQSILSDYYIFRVQWLYGQNGLHFLRTIAKIAQTNPILKVVNDQWGSPTWTWDIARVIASIIQSPIPFGMYHLPGHGYTNWYEVATLLLAELKLKNEVVPVTSDQFPRPAHRPKNGRLNSQKFDTVSTYHMPNWDVAIKEYLVQCPLT